MAEVVETESNYVLSQVLVSEPSFTVDMYRDGKTFVATEEDLFTMGCNLRS